MKKTNICEKLGNPSIQVCLILNQYSELLLREYTKRSAFQSRFNYPSGFYQILAFPNTIA